MSRKNLRGSSELEEIKQHFEEEVKQSYPKPKNPPT
jgi:hypothetical protein